MRLEKIVASENLAPLLKKEQRMEIARMVKEHYETDVESRSEWESSYKKWQDMAAQVREVKTTPWQNAANIKYPLLTQAALQFNARVVPALMPNSEPVGAAPIGPDHDGMKAEVAQTVAKHMNYQLTSEMTEWEEQFDKLLLAISISGTEFKKTYYDPYLGRNVSKHVSPKKLVINYYAEDDIAEVRKTEVHLWNRRYVREQVAGGIFSPVDFSMVGDSIPSEVPEIQEQSKERLGMTAPGVADSGSPDVYLEYHGWYDLDGDGYDEPYIIIIEKKTEQMVQMVARFSENSIQRNDKGKLLRIDPYESYTKYIFIPDPDGSFYGIGFGHLLYPINATVNTVINQLLDAGTLNNMPAGFISRGVRLRGGMFSMTPGKWLTVNTTGDDLRKGMLPLPTKDPSVVLFNLLAYMVESAEKLSSTTDIFTGEHPGQNTKVGVTEAVREEGQKVFTAIYKRIRRSLRTELVKLYSLNAQVLGSVLADETLIGYGASIFRVTAEMYAGDHNIQPSADPNLAVKEQKLQKDMTVLQLIMETGAGDVVEAVGRIFKTLEVENTDKLLPPNSVSGAQEQQKQAQQLETQKLQLEGAKLQQETVKAQVEVKKLEVDMAKAQGEAQQIGQEIQIENAKIQLEELIEKGKLKLEQMKIQSDANLKSRELDIKEMDVRAKVQIAKEDAMLREKEIESGAQIEQGKALMEGEIAKQELGLKSKEIDSKAKEHEHKSRELDIKETEVKNKGVESNAKAKAAARQPAKPR